MAGLGGGGGGRGGDCAGGHVVGGVGRGLAAARLDELDGTYHLLGAAGRLAHHPCAKLFPGRLPPGSGTQREESDAQLAGGPGGDGHGDGGGELLVGWIAAPSVAEGGGGRARGDGNWGEGGGGR